MDNFYVYMYLRSKNSKHGATGTPYYIGKGKGMRAYSKSHRVRPPVDRTMIVFVARDIPESEAFALEMSLIAKHGRIDNGTGCLRNLTDGGEGPSGAIASPKTRAKHIAIGKRRGLPIGCTMAGRSHAEETKERIKITNLRTWTPEKKAAHSEMMKALPTLHVPVHNTPHSAESIEKMRQSHLGRKASEETRIKMSISQRCRTREVLTHCKNGHPRNPENIRANGKGCAICHRQWAQRKKAVQQESQRCGLSAA